MLAFQNASLDDKCRSLLLMQKADIPDSRTSIFDCSGDKKLSTEPSAGDAGVYVVSTSTLQCSQVDLLTAIYCFTVLEFLVSKQTATDHTPLDSVSNERDQGDTKAIDDSEDIIDCRYVACLAQKLLWDVEVQRCQLQESELQIKDAIASLITRHKMSNLGENHGDPVVFDTAAQQTEPGLSPSKIPSKVTTRARDTIRKRWPFADCHKDGDDCLPTSDIGRKSLALDVVQNPEMSDSRFLATSNKFSEEDSTAKTEEYVVTEENRECTSTCTEGSTVDPLQVDADVVSKTMQDESYVSSNQTFDEIPKIAQPMKGLEVSDAEFQTDAVSCRYENIPDEWHSYPVDKKYHLPYVTVSVLQKELCRIQSELSEMPSCLEVSCCSYAIVLKRVEKDLLFAEKLFSRNSLHFDSYAEFYVRRYSKVMTALIISSATQVCSVA